MPLFFILLLYKVVPQFSSPCMISLSVTALVGRYFRMRVFWKVVISLTSELTNAVRPVLLAIVHQLLFNSSSDPSYQTSLFFQIRGLDIYCVLYKVLTKLGLRVLNYRMYCGGFFCRRKNRKSMLAVLLLFCMLEPKFCPTVQSNSRSCLFALKILIEILALIPGLTGLFFSAVYLFRSSFVLELSLS